nr:ATP-binding protein [Ramlibacter agri]
MALLAQLPGQVAVVDASGRILAVNAGWQRFAAETSLPPSRADGFEHLALCEAAHGANAAEALAAGAGFRAVLAGHSREYTVDFQSPAPSTRRWFRLQAVPVDWNGGPAALLMHTEITALRQARDEVLRLNANLERRVQRRTRQLENANRELEAFSYSVSHDLKAPLAAIDGFTQALQERLQGRLDPREAGYLERVRAGAGSMFTLIDAMLALHQVARSAPLRRADVDVSQLARGVLDELRAGDPDRLAEVEVEPAIHMQCDAALMAIVLRNLLGNAWKFSTGKPLVHVAVAQDWGGPAGATTLRIEDHGAGFDPQHAARLFMPFQRLHHSSEFPGTGIGLATVQRIVQRHGGSVRAEGRPGAGATFWVTLPDAQGFDSSREY